jgi:hypothetical protein
MTWARLLTDRASYYLPDVPVSEFVMDDKSNVKKEYTVMADAGYEITRHFCGNCASCVQEKWQFADEIRPLYDSSMRPRPTPLVFVYAGRSRLPKGRLTIGAFPPKSLPAPTIEIFLSRAEEWEPHYPTATVFQRDEGDD